ncbi:two-component system sensor histidine kinase [Flavobacteriaceae bacterium 3519-10]|nr:two-component system sensor histidine kinase [Flavobacteriaceae bacterium 3519-10]
MKIIHSPFLCILLLVFACSDKKEVSAADTLYKKAERLYDGGEYEQAFPGFYSAYQAYMTEQKPRDAAYSLVFLAIIQTEKGDFLGSNENLSKALKLSATDETLLTSVYNQFAINHNLLQNHENAVYWYHKALPLTEHQYYKLSIKNNIGIAYLKMGRYATAESLFKEIAGEDAIKDSISFHNRVADNFAYSKFLAGKNNPAEREMLTVLESRKRNGDRYGLTTSYSHLADFYKATDRRRSYEFAGAMHDNARITGNAADQLEALGKMIDAGEAARIKSLFGTYRKLNDSLQNSRNRSRHHFTSVIYEAEKNKADLLSSRNEILTQRLLIVALMIIAGLATVLFLKWRRKQAHKNEIAVRDTQLKYSKKVHDVVANGLYHTMVEIQNAEVLNRHKVLNSIEKLYEESRDIARDDFDTVIEQDFSVRLYEMLESYSSGRHRVLVIGNTWELWRRIAPEVQVEIFYVLRELMVNMKKHSEARTASLLFEETAGGIHIKYTDNGVGISDSAKWKGSGLRNMENRIDKLGGKINFGPNPSGGLITDILIPKN